MLSEEEMEQNKKRTAAFEGPRTTFYLVPSICMSFDSVNDTEVSVFVSMTQHNTKRQKME